MKKLAAVPSTAAAVPSTTAATTTESTTAETTSAKSATGEAAAMETTAETASARDCAHAASTDAERMPELSRVAGRAAVYVSRPVGLVSRPEMMVALADASRITPSSVASVAPVAEVRRPESHPWGVEAPTERVVKDAFARDEGIG